MIQEHSQVKDLKPGDIVLVKYAGEYGATFLKLGRSVFSLEKEAKELLEDKSSYNLK